MDALSLTFAIIAVGVLIIIHEAGHYFAAKWSNMRVRRFSIGFGPPIAKVVRDGTEFTIAVIPFGGFVQIDGMSPHDGTDPDAPTSYLKRPFHQKFATVLAGPVANYILGFFLWFGLLAAFNFEPLPPIEVTKVQAEAPAAAAGIEAGDLLLGVGGRPYASIDDFLKSIDTSGGEAIAFDVERAGEKKTIVVQPKAVGDKFRIGVGFAAVNRKSAPLGLAEAAQESWRRVVSWTMSPFIMIKGMIAGALGFDDVSGPAGIVMQLEQAFQRSWVDALSFAAGISIALGIFNLLPIPSLDGSRLLFLLIGLIRRRPVEPKLESYVHAGGLVLMLGLLVVVTVFDFLR